MSTPTDRLTDKRIVERNIDKGLLTKEELEKHLAALPDVSANAEYLTIHDDYDDEDEDEDEEA